MKLFFKCLLIICISYTAKAQVGIGNTNPQGALDITSVDNGLLIPRVALVNLTTTTVLTPTESEMVYNTTSNGVVEPGYYYLLDIAGTFTWVRFGGSGWLLDGNTGVTAASFMGSINNADVAFRRNNLAAGKIGFTSTSYGLNALTNGGASNSTAIGNNALSVSTGQNNVAVGQNALRNSNTTAQWNTAVGTNALSGISSNAAQHNTALGFDAMATGTGNISETVAIGSSALRVNTGSKNTAVGYRALFDNTTGISNVALGDQALARNTVAEFNVGIGTEALFVLNGTLAGGSGNIALGYQAGNAISTGGKNIAIGFQAQVPSATGSNQLNIGNWIYGNSGNIGIGVAVPTEKLEVNGKIRAVDVNFSGLPVYADEAAAIVGGIATGDLYQTPTGAIRIKL